MTGDSEHGRKIVRVELVAGGTCGCGCAAAVQDFRWTTISDSLQERYLDEARFGRDMMEVTRCGYFLR